MSEAVLQLRVWFRGLVDDNDVMETTAISIDDLQNSVHTAPELTERREFLDVGILRFPDVFRPYIQVRNFGPLKG